MLMVLEMAPEMNGCAAAIIRMWLSTERCRVPVRPQTDGAVEHRQMLGLQAGRALQVIAPQTWMFAASISSLAKPSAESRQKPGSSSRSASMPRRSTQKRSPSVHLLKTKRMSKASASARSTAAIASSVKPLARSAAWSIAGESRSVPWPTA